MLSTGVLQLVLMAGVMMLIIGPWVVPATGAIVMPAMVHVTLLQPNPATVTVVAYSAGVIWIRTFWLQQLSSLRIRISIDKDL